MRRKDTYNIMDIDDIICSECGKYLKHSYVRGDNYATVEPCHSCVTNVEDDHDDTNTTIR